MFERFTTDARETIHRAVAHVQDTGQTSVEAEHLLLALADSPELGHLRLDRQELSDALAEEERLSLAAVGVMAESHPPTRSGRRTSRPSFGASAKLALARGVKLAEQRGERRFRSQDILGGVLAAEHGRVPRALELAGVNVEDLRRGTQP